MASGSSSRGRFRSCSRVLAAAALLIVVAGQLEIARAARFSAAQGLPPAAVTAIAADDGGRLWVGTSAGLRMLAGGSFVVEAGMTDPGIASPVYRESINDLAVSPSGEVWVATGGTLHRRTADGSWQEAAGRDAGLDGGIAAVAVTPDGSIWAGGANAGLARWDGVAWHLIDRSLQVAELAVDGSGNLWVAGARDGEILVENPGHPHERVLRLGSGGLPDASPQALEARGDVLWVGTGNGLARLDATGSVTLFDRAAGLPSSSILSIAPVDDDEAWVGTAEGLAHLVGTTVDPGPGVAAGLAGRWIDSLELDRAGDLWIGTPIGLASLPLRSWVPPEDPVSGFIAAVGRAAAAGVGYAVSDGRLYIADGAGWTGVSGLEGRQVTTALADRAGSIVVGTDAGWGIVRDGGFVPDARCCTSRVEAILEDAVGRLWIGTGEGVVVVDDRGPVATFRKTSEFAGLGQDPVTDIWSDAAGTVWVATLNGGATPFAGLQPGPRISLNSTGGGLVSDLVIAGLVARDGELWLGTQAGLSRRADGGWTTETGPLGGSISSLADGGGGRVWVGTEASGLALVDCGITVDGGCAVSLFDEADGLAATQVTALASLDGELWIGTSRGLTRHALDTAPPTLTLGNVEAVPAAGGDYLELHPGRLLVDDRACEASCASALLPHDARAVDVGLIGTDPDDPKGVRLLVDRGDGRPQVVDGIGVRQLLTPDTRYGLTAIAFDRHFNRSAPVSLALRTAAVPLVEQPWFLVTLFALAAAAAILGWIRWQRRFRLRYRDATVSFRTTDAGIEARMESGPGPAPWQPVALDLPRLEALHDRFRAMEGPDAALLRTLGDELRRPVRAGHENVLDPRARRPLRLALDFTAAATLEALPWELMHGGGEPAPPVGGGNLALLRLAGAPDPDGASREGAAATLAQPSRGGGGGRARPIVTAGRLRVLVAWAKPRDRPFVAATEFEEIEEVARHSGGRLEVIRMPVVQRERLLGELDQDVDVLHFIGHGEMRDGQPVLLFEDEDGWKHDATGSTISEILRQAGTRTRRPRLVVLSACQSAESSIGQPATGLAEQLVANGTVPAAVGMGYVFPTEAASRFSPELYRSLIRHGQIEHAVAVARSALMTEDGERRDWAVPRLYARELGAATFEFLGGGR